MSSLLTDFIKVAQSGPTADGRNIDPQDLRDMAEAYDTKVYEAVIWPDHERFYGNHGSVAALKAQEAGELVELYAQLRPGWRFLEKNKDEQKLYSSIEIWDDFGGTGKPYLAGLAITDTPASLGTERIRLFTARRKEFKQDPGTFFPGVQLPNIFTEDRTGLAPEEAHQAFTLLQRLGLVFGMGRAASLQTEETPEDNSMDDKQFQQMLGVMEQNTEAVKALADKFTTPEQGKPVPPAPAEEVKDLKPTELSNQLQTLTDTMNGMAKSFATMAERMEGNVPGTVAPETPNPASQGIL